jgi:hypothetical protein
MQRNIIKCAALAGMMVFFGGCKKEFLDVNQNPNNPADATVDLVLPTAMGYTAYTMGNQYQLIGGILSQYWTQGPTASQYLDYDKYIINAADQDRPWQQLYSGALNDLKFVETRAHAENKPYYEAVSLLMQAYIYQYLTDIYGDVPFSQALKGESENGGITSPIYDPQEKVYQGILGMVDHGLALLNENSDVVPGSDDLVYGGDLTLWWKFGNTLKLKILLRESDKSPSVAQAGITSLDTSGAEFLDAGEDAKINFSTTKFNTNPLYSAIQGLNNVPNLIASATSIDYLTATNDPRIDVFYIPNASGVHVGMAQGHSHNLPNPAAESPTKYSRPSPNVAGATAPVILMSAAESKFLQAEAAARGWLTATGSDADLYAEGVHASFDYWGLNSDDADSLLANPDVAYPASGSLTDKLHAIFIQKWVAMNSTQSIEAWIEHRRFYANDANQFLKPSESSTLGPNLLPQRLAYPSSELTRNPNVPKSTTISTPVWWDVQ